MSKLSVWVTHSPRVENSGDGCFTRGLSSLFFSLRDLRVHQSVGFGFIPYGSVPLILGSQLERIWGSPRSIAR